MKQISFSPEFGKSYRKWRENAMKMRKCHENDLNVFGKFQVFNRFD